MDIVSHWIDTLGVRVVHGDLGSMYGCYLKDHHAIILNSSLAPIQRRSTVMHELGHAFHGHSETTPQTERQASEWSARELIRWCDYMCLTRIHDTAQGVASELGVLPRDVENYATWMRRQVRCPSG